MKKSTLLTALVAVNLVSSLAFAQFSPIKNGKVGIRDFSDTTVKLTRVMVLLNDENAETIFSELKKSKYTVESIESGVTARENMEAGIVCKKDLAKNIKANCILMLGF